MSRPELHKTDSTVLDPPDSDSVPSEPPDIRNWFSSYAYISPELNTLDDLQDFHGSGETCLQEGKKSREIRAAAKSIDGLLSTGRESLDKAINCEKSDEFEYIKPSALVAESSESLSFSSEPPDIKNWFSSYFYESSPLDTTHEFAISGYKAKGDDELYNAQRNSKNDNYDVKGGIELPTQSIASHVVVKCTNLVKDTQLAYKPVDKVAHTGSLSPMPSIHSLLTYQKVSQQILPGKMAGNYDFGATQKHGDTTTYDKENDMKSDSSLFVRTVPKSLNMENTKESKAVQKWTGSKDCTKNGLEKEDLQAIDLTVSKEDSSRSQFNKRSIGKENKESELSENGFVSIRKNSKEIVGNSTRPAQFQFESSGNGVKPATRSRENGPAPFQFESSGHGVKPVTRSRENGNTSRKVLSETSNFLSPGTLESTGKWCCPQKNKPKFGPPLKQLRMEQWVRRV